MKRTSIAVVAALFLTSVAICIQAACPCGRAGAVVLTTAGGTVPHVSTDKPDYSPGETVKISGSGFCPAEHLLIRVTRPDGSVVTGDGSFEPWPTDYDNVVADVKGELSYSYVLDGIEGEYLIEVLDSYGSVLATRTFTDGGAITGVTLMYLGQVGTHVIVPPGASILAIVTVQTYDEEYDASNDWEGTKWLIANSPLGPGGAWPWGTCVDHENHSGAGTYTEVLTMTAPMLAGTYNVYFYVYHCDYFGVPISQYRPCSSVFDDFQLSGAVEVECTPPSISSPTDITQACDPGACGAVVTWPAPTATGNPPPTVVCSPSSGSFFPVGGTTVTCTATNTCGTDTSYFTVAVADAEPPQVTCPGDITQENDPGVCQAAVTIQPLAATDNCGVASIVNSYTGTADASGIYPVGSTAVLWTVTDIHGNSSTCTMNVTVTDAEGPTVEFVATPQNASNEAEPQVDWQGADANSCTPSEGLQFSTNLDASGWSGWSASLSETLGLLGEGEHTFEVRAKDEADNVGDGDSYTWYVDLTAPVTNFTTIPPDPDNDATPDFIWAGSDDNTASVDLLYQTNLDGGGWSGFSSGKSITLGTLAEGSHTFEVRAKDEAGNVGETTSSTWRIDLTPPVIRLTVPSEQAVYLHGSAIFADWSVSDNEPGTSLSVNATCASGVAIDTATAGTRSFFVEVTDSAGNVERIDVSYRVAYVVRGAQPVGEGVVGGSEETPCFLDKCIASDGTSIEEAPLTATYELGETIGIAAAVTGLDGAPITGALCTVTFVEVTSTGEDEQHNIVGCFMLPYVTDLGIYMIDIATLGDEWGLEVGYYDLWLDLDDETHIRQRITIVEPT